MSEYHWLDNLLRDEEMKYWIEQSKMVEQEWSERLKATKVLDEITRLSKI